MAQASVLKIYRADLIPGDATATTSSSRAFPVAIHSLRPHPFIPGCTEFEVEWSNGCLQFEADIVITRYVIDGEKLLAAYRKKWAAYNEELEIEKELAKLRSNPPWDSNGPLDKMVEAFAKNAMNKNTAQKQAFSRYLKETYNITDESDSD